MNHHKGHSFFIKNKIRITKENKTILTFIIIIIIIFVFFITKRKLLII